MATTKVQDGTRSATPGTLIKFTFGNATKNKRTITAKPAAFDAVDRKPETGVGAPSYTSGAQKWNGTKEILKPRPTSIKASTPEAVRSDKLPALNMVANWYKSVVPEKPKTRLKPYNIIVDVNVPNRKYLKPASVDLSSANRKPERI